MDWDFAGETHTVRATLILARGKTFELRYEVDGIGEAGLSKRGDWLVALLLPLCIAKGEDLQIDLPISPRLMAASRMISDIYACWLPAFTGSRSEGSTSRLPRICGSTMDGEEPRPVATGLFFSAGVDSFYSLLAGRHASQISHLIFVRGLDISLAPRYHSLHARIVNATQDIAKSTNTHLVNVSTNIRELSDGVIPWIMYNGAALAGTGLLLDTVFARTIIAASDSFAELEIGGSHPLLDPLWSTERQSIHHDGCEFRRSEKIEAISPYATVREHLRVCWENRNLTYNCSRCEKCLRTMIVIDTLNQLSEFTAFASNVRLRDMLGLKTRDVVFWQNDIARFVSRHRDWRMRAGVRAVLGANSVAARLPPTVRRTVRSTYRRLVS